jgi:SAM-dependent methyltransferase
MTTDTVGPGFDPDDTDSLFSVSGHRPARVVGHRACKVSQKQGSGSRIVPFLRGRLRATSLWGRAHARWVWPPVGLVRFGSLRRLRPIGKKAGAYRGQPIDRYYIERFLSRHAGRPGYVLGDIRGYVLEVGDDQYTRALGQSSEAGRAGVERVDILHADAGNPRATIVADLARGDEIPPDTYDCVICTQTLLLIYDVRAAIRTLHRILKPGGVVLATVPGISQLCRPDADLWGDYWRFTSRSARRLFEESFQPDNVTVESFGNVLAAIAFLHGLSAEDLRESELELRDPDFELLIGVRAVK